MRQNTEYTFLLPFQQASALQHRFLWQRDIETRTSQSLQTTDYFYLQNLQNDVIRCSGEISGAQFTLTLPIYGTHLVAIPAAVNTVTELRTAIIQEAQTNRQK